MRRPTARHLGAVRADVVPAPSPRDTDVPRRSSPRRAKENVVGEKESYRGLPLEREERASFLRSLDAEPEVIAHAVGVDRWSTGEDFACAIGGAAHKGGTAHLEGRDSGRVVYVCDCDADDFERSLTEVFVGRTVAIPLGRRLSKSEFVRWKLRLAIEAGVLEAPSVLLPPLPPDATENARAVYQGLLSFVPVRLLSDGPDVPFTFSRKFASAWCGLDLDKTAAGLRSLVGYGVLVVVGAEPAGPHKAHLYELGTGAAP